MVPHILFGRLPQAVTQEKQRLLCTWPLKTPSARGGKGHRWEGGLLICFASAIFLTGSSSRTTHPPTLTPFPPPSWPSSRSVDACLPSVRQHRSLGLIEPGRKYSFEDQEIQAGLASRRSAWRMVLFAVCLLSDPHRRGLEWGDVQRDSLTRRSEVRHVVLHLFHRAHAVRKLYPSCLHF